jgi:hypothetical protein
MTTRWVSRNAAAARAMSCGSAIGRCAGSRRLGVDDGRLSGFPEFDHIALQPAEIEMGGPRGVGQRRAPGMAQEPRQLGGRIDRGREFGDGREQRRVGDFLIGVAMLERGLLAPGQRHHRTAPEPCILQTRGEVGGADRLRHAHPRPAPHPGIAVGHVGGGLFRMGEDAGDAEVVEFEQRAAQDRFDEKDVRRAGVGQGARQPLGAIHCGSFAQLWYPSLGPEGRHVWSVVTESAARENSRAPERPDLIVRRSGSRECALRATIARGDLRLVRRRLRVARYTLKIVLRLAESVQNSECIGVE